MRILIVLIFVLTTTSLAKEKQWQTGYVLHFGKAETGFTTESSTNGSIDSDDNYNSRTSGGSHRIYKYVLMIDIGEFIVSADFRLLFHSPLVTENSEIKWAFDGRKKMIIIDDAGRKFTLDITNRRKK